MTDKRATEIASKAERIFHIIEAAPNASLTCQGFLFGHSEVATRIAMFVLMRDEPDKIEVIERINEDNASEVVEAIEHMLAPTTDGNRSPPCTEMGKAFFALAYLDPEGRLKYDEDSVIGCLSACNPGMCPYLRPNTEGFEARLRQAINVSLKEVGREKEISVETDGNTVFIDMEDGLWAFDCAQYGIPRQISHMPVQHIMDIAREIICYHDKLKDCKVRNQIKEDMEILRTSVAAAIAEVPNATMIYFGASYAHFTSKGVPLTTFQAGIYGDSDALDPAVTHVTFEQFEDGWLTEKLHAALSAQKRRNVAKKQAGSGWILVDKVLARYLGKVCHEIGNGKFDETFALFPDNYPSRKAMREELESEWGATLPPEIESVTLKDGRLSGAIQISEEVLWKEGKLIWKTALPETLAKSLKGKKGSAIIDLDPIRHMTVSGSRMGEDAQSHIFSFKDLWTTYDKAFPPTQRQDAGQA